MAPAKPSLDLLRSLTDEHVLRALMEQRRLTRAELAARTGHLQADHLRERAPAGRGRAGRGHRRAHHRAAGRVGSYYALADDVGVRAGGQHRPGRHRRRDRRRARRRSPRATERGRPRRPGPAQVAAALRTAAPDRAGVRRRPARLAVVSAADPVDRATGRLVHLPDAPFLRRRTRPRPTSCDRSSTARSSSTTTSTGRRGPNAQRRRRGAGRLRLPATSARDWAAPSSATAQVRRGARRPRRRDRPRGHRPGRHGQAMPLHGGVRRARPAPRRIHRHRRPHPARHHAEGPERTRTRDALARAVCDVLAATRGPRRPGVVSSSAEPGAAIPAS